MRILGSLLIVLFSFGCVDAQYGLDLRYSSNNYSNLHGHGGELGDNLFNKNFEIGIDYWLRLGGYRIEFFPQIFYGFDRQSTIEDQPIDHNFKELGLRLNTHFYVFNFREDCDCPTFSKRGNFFTKGFFLNTVTGLNGQRQGVRLVSDDLDFSQNYYRLQLGAGAGIDIGISDLITLTPFANYIFSLANSIGESEIADINPDELQSDAADATSFQFGIRIGFRPDYKTYKPKKFY